MLSVLGLLGACVAVEPPGQPLPEGVFRTLPEDVAAVADPRLLASTYRIDPVDNCYLFEYNGPVETTYLPLRTVEGRPICRAPEEEPAEAA